MFNQYTNNTLDSESLDSIIYYTTKTNYETGHTCDYYGINDDKHLDKWKYENFSYTINKYGFRYSPLVDHADIGAFGCSYTFGQSMPENRLWHSLLAKETKSTSINFGIAGKGIETIVDIFCIVSKHIKLKKAVFLLPPSTRLQIHTNTENEFFYSDYTVQHRIEFSEKLFQVLPDEHLQHISKKNLYLAEYVAKQRGIEIYFASWHSELCTLLKNMKFSYAKLLPDWTDSLVDRARDMEHPGPLAHEKWVKKILPYFQRK